MSKYSKKNIVCYYNTEEPTPNEEIAARWQWGSLVVSKDYPLNGSS